jgi:hypothetical protein
MIELNDHNGASALTAKCIDDILKSFTGHLYAAEFGVAYGGGIQRIARKLEDRGFVYGFDTFAGHPQEVANLCEKTIEDGGVNAHAAYCMQPWYEKGGEYEMSKLSTEYISAQLKTEGLNNVQLCKGLVTDKTDVSFIPKLHYCLLDLDYPLSMEQSYQLIKDKIVSGGYLCLHDVIPKGHINGLYELYQTILKEGFELVSEHPQSFLVILKKK